MQHTQNYSNPHPLSCFRQVNIQMLAALVCAVWLAMGGLIPAHAATPASGGLTPLPQPVVPTRLQIPELEIDAPVEGVGQDGDDYMAAPSTVGRVAWYNRGPIPGEPGNAVMAGHLDDVKGRPAVFWDLDELEVDDEIVVQLSDDSEIRFAVVSVETYDADAAPLARIFGVDFERDLNLITCDGEWNAQSKLYEKRLVVYARRIHDADAVVMPDSEFGDDSTQASTTPSSPIQTPTRSPYTRQDRGQPLAAR